MKILVVIIILISSIMYVLYYSHCVQFVKIDLILGNSSIKSKFKCFK